MSKAARAIALALVSALVTHWYVARADIENVEHMQSRLVLGAERSGLSDTRSVTGARTGPFGARDDLRRARARRDALRSQVADLELLLDIKDAREREELAASVRNCALMVGTSRMAECPLAFESPEMLRHLERCGLFAYDVPRLVLDPAHADATVPWDELATDAATRERLARIDEALSASLQEDMRRAYHETFGVDAPDGMSPSDALREFLRSPNARHAEWAYSEAARARLGVVGDAEISELPPLARFYVKVATVGDEYERSLADVLGKDRARELRRSQGGWDAQGIAGGGTESEGCGMDIRGEPQ